MRLPCRLPLLPLLPLPLPLLPLLPLRVRVRVRLPVARVAVRVEGNLRPRLGRPQCEVFAPGDLYKERG